MPLTIPPSTYANQISFTPTGSIAASNVQSAIAELDLETVHTSGNEDIGGIKIFTDTTDSTNPTSGGVQCRGGFGVTKNLSVGANLLLTNYPSVCARRTSNLSLSSNSTTKFAYNSEDSDSHNAYNNSTGTFTVPSNCGGKYEVSAAVSISFFGSSGTIVIYLMVYVNDQFYTTLGRALATGIASATDGCSGKADIPNLAAADTIDIRVNAYFSSGGTITMAGSDKCSLSIKRI
ncbi:hypothetical protein LC593_35805 [Nostoc sp. CHAB 5844]|nr:hypothetical protein [Nostoc sp. CHAB 5844]